MTDVIIVLVVGTLAGSIPLAVAIRFVISEAGKSRKVAEARAVAQQTYITEIQNRLNAHTWGEFAQLQNEVDNHTAQTARALNSFGEARAEEAFGESEEDIIDRYLEANGIGLEGATIG